MSMVPAKVETVAPRRPSRRGDPTWELGEGALRQGDWTEAAYLALDSNRLIEFTDGVLEFLPMPKLSHARISRYLSDRLRGHVESRQLGEVFWAPVSVRLRTGQLREPDVFFLAAGHSRTADVPDGADLVLEIVSPDARSRRRDLDEKRREYAESGIPEYWIVDPEAESITVLSLPVGAAEYLTSGEYKTGQTAVSVLLPGFAVDVSACFEAGRGQGDAVAPPSPH